MLIPKQWIRLVGGVFAFFLVVALLNHVEMLGSTRQLVGSSAEAFSNRLKDMLPYRPQAEELDPQLDQAQLAPAIATHTTPHQDGSHQAPDTLILEGTRIPDAPTTLQTIAITSPPAEETKLSQPDPASSTFRKTIVMGKLMSEDTDWVPQNLASWNQAIYVVDALANQTSPTGLKTKMNKAKEATPYLTFLVEHYDDFPDVAVFLHAHRNGWPQAWHNDAQDYDAVNMLNRLRLDTVLDRGYVNLRCLSTPGCPKEIDLHRYPPNEEKAAEIAYPYVYSQFFNMTVDEVREQVPIVASPCCAQFAVSKEQVHQRPKAEYERFLALIETSTYEDHILGTVMEYMWHILFGRDAVYCEDVSSCYKAVYGRGGRW